MAHDDEDDPPTLERYVSFGDPCVIARELSGREAARLALLELAAADAEASFHVVTARVA